MASLRSEAYVRVQLPQGDTSYARVSGAREAGSIVSANQLEFLDRAPWLAAGGQPSTQRFSGQQLPLLCPVEPSKIVAIGRNYRAHAAEFGGDVPSEPLMFLKPPSALLAPGGQVVLPPQSQRVDFEAELGVVIGQRARHVSVADALQFVFGYTALCDVTARDLQKKDGQWSRAKGFDSFCPVGPCVVTGIDPSELFIVLDQNGERKQAGNTKDLVFSVATLVSYISSVMTLEPGDLIATGTPEGVGPLKSGDRVDIEIEHIGVLNFSVT